VPIPNDQFVPPVVCNSQQVQQIIAWIGGRPVPTMAEIGGSPTRHSGEMTIRATVKTSKITTPETPVKIKRPPPIIKAPTRIVPPPKKRA